MVTVFVGFHPTYELAGERVEYARNNVYKSDLRGFIKIGFISKDVITILDTNSNILKFSIENLVKNLLVHSDVTFEDYKIIPLISSNPDKIVKSKNGYDVMLFKAGNKFYKLVIKTTKNKAENYIKSFHLLEQERYEKY
jgi:hypothetical protein